MENMNYNSTRDSAYKVSSAQAITQGISKEGGLFVPECLPQLSLDDLRGLLGKSYNEKAKAVLSLFLTDFSKAELDYCVDGAYTDQKFDSDNIFELAKVGSGEYFLELWHGPTCAFKDMALQLLPYLLSVSAKKTAADKEIVVLVATSGDTGKAALEGFRDVPQTKMLVFYPESGVSRMQKLQMTTQEGENVAVCAIKGNFDDAQSGVKKIFTDPAINQKLAENNQMFSSANSINWGRLVPQIVYYIAAYLNLCEQEEIKLGEAINIVVPTGNFGNILAAYYAKRIGLPVEKLICASNKNKVLTDFLQTGVYDRNRDFYTTSSPSMDILISSNLERLLYELSGRNDAAICDWFSQLANDGRYEVPAEVKAKLQLEFYGGFCDEKETAGTIQRLFDKYGYLCDTHTAVGAKVYADYYAETGDLTKTLVASTASPYKFTASVLSAITDQPIPENDFAQLDLLQELSGIPVPKALAELESKPVRFSDSVEKEGMVEQVLAML